jgi:hypothetical protein
VQFDARVRGHVVDYGPASTLVHRVIDRAGTLTIDEAADLYPAYGARLLIHGVEAERHALAQAGHAAAVAGLEREYNQARHDAARAWRQALPHEQGPWLMVGRAIANAAGTLVVNGVLDDKQFDLLTGPWRQAIGMLTPVGPGVRSRDRAPARR